jgi:hypothetical protein
VFWGYSAKIDWHYRRVHRDHGPDALSIFKDLTKRLILLSWADERAKSFGRLKAIEPKVNVISKLNWPGNPANMNHL